MKEQFQVSATSGPTTIDSDGDPVVEHNIKLRINMDMPQDLDPEVNKRKEKELQEAITSAIKAELERTNHEKSLA